MLSLVKPTSGWVEILGRKVSPSRSEVYERVGSMVETPGFYPNLSVYDNLDVHRSLLGIRGSKPIHEALEGTYRYPGSSYVPRLPSASCRQPAKGVQGQDVLGRPEVVVFLHHRGGDGLLVNPVVHSPVPGSIADRQGTLA
ncbi:MAG: hypothetical protein AB1700_17920 [Bacillota bacterium]